MELPQLIKECKKQSVTGQKYLFDHFAFSMFILCRRYVKTDVAAEEVMMNGFLKFFYSLEQFNYVNEAATLGWLKKIMVNECLMFLRSNNSFLQVTMDDLPEVGLNEEIISGISADEILRVITKLPLGYRTVFNLHEIEDYSHKEIANLLGITEGTSKSQLNKARSVLQQLLIQENSEYATRKSK